MNINLSKKEMQNTLNIHLSKAGYTDGVEAKVCIVLDGSHSMSQLYGDGTVQSLVNRALVIGEKFDDDGTINVFDFSNGSNHRRLADATQEDFGTYMNNKRMIGGGTSYGPVLKRVESFFYDAQEATKAVKGTEGSKGFFGFGKKASTPDIPATEAQAAEGREGFDDNHPVYVIFITDGETLCPGDDKVIIDQIMNRREDMFVQFIGIGRSNFGFLQNMQYSFTNCGFAEVPDLDRISEEELIRKFLPEEAKAVLK